MQLWPRYFSDDLACVKKYQDKEKQKAIDKAAADGGGLGAVLDASSSVRG